MQRANVKWIRCKELMWNELEAKLDAMFYIFDDPFLK